MAHSHTSIHSLVTIHSSTCNSLHVFRYTFSTQVHSYFSIHSTEALHSCLTITLLVVHDSFLCFGTFVNSNSFLYHDTLFGLQFIYRFRYSLQQRFIHLWWYTSHRQLIRTSRILSSQTIHFHFSVQLQHSQFISYVTIQLSEYDSFAHFGKLIISNSF